MRIAVIWAPAKKTASPDYAQSLAKGMEKMGHRADLINAWHDNGMRLPGYEYIAAVTESISAFSAKIPEALPKILASASSLSGKKSAAFVKKGGFRTGRTLINAMRAMEKEGMIINWSDVLLNVNHAQAIGKQIGS